MLNKKNSERGFTLVELLVVIAIIGILAVVAVPNLFNSIYKAKASELESDYSSIKSALLSYYSDNSELPSGSIKPSDPTISKYIDGIDDKSPVGGEYEIVDKLDEQLTKIGELGANGSISIIKASEINNKFKSILVVNNVGNSDYPQLTEKQSKQLLKDIGYGKVYVDGPDTFNDGHTIIYLGLIEK